MEQQRIKQPPNAATDSAAQVIEASPSDQTLTATPRSAEPPDHASPLDSDSSITSAEALLAQPQPLPLSRPHAVQRTYSSTTESTHSSSSEITHLRPSQQWYIQTDPKWLDPSDVVQTMKTLPPQRGFETRQRSLLEKAKHVFKRVLGKRRTARWPLKRSLSSLFSGSAEPGDA